MERPPFVPFSATTMMWRIYLLPITSRLEYQHTLFTFKFLAHAVGWPILGLQYIQVLFRRRRSCAEENDRVPSSVLRDCLLQF